MIIRTPNRDRYVIISKVPLEDKRLSWKARGLHAYLMSKPDHWTVIVKALVNEAPDGRDSVFSALKELQKYGYITQEFKRGADQQFDGTQWTVFEEPTNDPASGLPVSGSAASGKSDPSEEGTGVINETTDISSADGGQDKMSKIEKDFTMVWEHYPRNDGRKVALKAYGARIKEGISPDILLSAAKNYAAQRIGKDREHLMLGSTFFGPNERWKDFVDSTTSSDPNPAGLRIYVPAEDLEKSRREQDEWEAEMARRTEVSTKMPDHVKADLRKMAGSLASSHRV